MVMILFLLTLFTVCEQWKGQLSKCYWEVKESEGVFHSTKNTGLKFWLSVWQMEQYFQVNTHVPSFGRKERTLDYADTLNFGSKKLGPSRMVKWNGLHFSVFYSGNFPFHSLPNSEYPEFLVK